MKAWLTTIAFVGAFVVGFTLGTRSSTSTKQALRPYFHELYDIDTFGPAWRCCIERPAIIAQLTLPKTFYIPGYYECWNPRTDGLCYMADD